MLHKTEKFPAGIAMFFQLPAKVDDCFKVLFTEVKRPQSDTKKRIMQQAERTAWKIISDWVAGTAEHDPTRTGRVAASVPSICI